MTREEAIKIAEATLAERQIVVQGFRKAFVYAGSFWVVFDAIPDKRFGVGIVRVEVDMETKRAAVIPSR